MEPMEISILIFTIASVLCILIDGWAMLRVWRAYQEAVKKRETCGMFGKNIRPYTRIMQLATVGCGVCIGLRIIFQEIL